MDLDGHLIHQLNGQGDNTVQHVLGVVLGLQRLSSRGDLLTHTNNLSTVALGMAAVALAVSP